MGGKVLRCAGVALLAGIFLAATTACGQTLAAIQTAENHNESQAPATDPSTLSWVSGVRWAPSESMDRTRARAGAGPDEDSASPENTLASKEASYISDSGDAELPAAPAPAPPEDQSAPYEPITGRQRLNWGIRSAIWPEHLVAGVITSAVGTGLNRPRQDGPHWGGFGERFGVRLTGVATSNAMEAGFGALWGEDPRYFRVPEEPLGVRVKNVIKMTFLARRSDGDFAPAYARFIAVPGNNFLTNAWRPDGEANVHDAVLRTFEGFAGRMVSNAWNEFWPQAKAYLLHRRDHQP